MTNQATQQTLAKTKPMIMVARNLAATIAMPIKRDAVQAQLVAAAHDKDIVFTLRDAFETIECATVLHLCSAHQPADHQLAQMIDLCAQLPTQTVRSEVQVSAQQFSTPAPLALFAQSRAMIGATDIVLEPSAGTGLMVTQAARIGAALHLNELDQQRFALLCALFPSATLTNHDALGRRRRD